jgi:hypothetical protein
MNLLQTFEELLEMWSDIFPQRRTFLRARRLLFGQASLLVSPQTAGPARALPVRFEPAPLPAKPKKTLPSKSSNSTASRSRLAASAELESRSWFQCVTASINMPTLRTAKCSPW